MKRGLDFIRDEQDMNDLLKAAVINFHVACCHPCFDGNGRIARFLHLWYLIQNCYPSTLFIPLPVLIGCSRQGYYKTYTLVVDNAKLSGVMDVTPFPTYFISRVYGKLPEQVTPPDDTQDAFLGYLQSGQVTEKEKDLWNFRAVCLRDRRFFHKAVGEGLRRRRIRHHTGFCHEVREVRTSEGTEVWK